MNARRFIGNVSGKALEGLALIAAVIALASIATADLLDRMGRNGSLQQFAFFKGAGYATAAHNSPKGRGGDSGVDYSPTASIRRSYVEQRSVLDAPLKK